METGPNTRFALPEKAEFGNIVSGVFNLVLAMDNFYT